MKLRVCRRCGTAVRKSWVIGYKYYCPNHDEDLFEFETYLIDIPGMKRRKTTTTTRRKTTMSTRSNIGMKLADGRVKAIYCHWDGYPEDGGVGNTLRKYYTDKERVERLLDLGSLSSLGKKLYPTDPQKHSFYDPEEDVTVAYHRDRDEEFHDMIFDSVDAYAASMEESWAEFIYLYDTDGKWYVYSPYLKEEYRPNKWNDLEWLINEIESKES